MADIPPFEPPSDDDDDRVVPPGPQLRLDLEELYRTLIRPQIEAQERLRRTVSGDVDSLAWWLTDSDRGVSQMLRQFNADSVRNWTADGPPIGPRLEEQIWNIHRGLSDPDYGLTKVIYDQFGNISRILSDPATPSTDALIKALDALKGVMDDSDPDLLEKLAQEGIAGAVSDPDGHPFGWAAAAGILPALLRLLTWLKTAAPALGKAAASSTVATAVGNGIAGVAALAALDQFLQNVDIDTGKFNPLDVLPGVRGAFAQLFQEMIEAMQQTIRAVPGDDPDGVRLRAGNALSVALQWGMLAHGLAVAVERISPLKQMGIGQMGAFMADMGAFQPLSTSIWNHLITEAIDIPLTYNYRSEYRSRIPPQGEIFAAARKWEFQNYDEFDRWIAMQGITPYWGRLMWRFIWADPRLTDIVRMADISIDTGTPPPDKASDLAHYQVDPNDPDWWLDLKFKKAGYDGVDIPVLKKVVHARMVATYLTRHRTQIRDHFKKGLYTEDEFRHAMQEAGTQPDAIELDVHTVKLEREQQRVSDLLAEHDRRFLSGAIAEEDLRLEYHGLIHDEAIAEATIQTLILRRDGQVASAARSETKSALRSAQTALVNAYKEQHKRGLIDDDQLLGSLLAIELHPALAAAIVQLESVRRLPVPKASAKTPEQEALENAQRILTDAYINQYRAGAIDDAGLLANLQTIGLHESVAEAKLQLELSRKMLEARKAADAAAAKLARETEAVAKRQAEQEARKADQTLTDLENRYITLITTQYDKGLIDEASALGRLVRAGIPDTKARIIVSTAAAKKKRDPSFLTDPPFEPRATGL